MSSTRRAIPRAATLLVLLSTSLAGPPQSGRAGGPPGKLSPPKAEGAAKVEDVGIAPTIPDVSAPKPEARAPEQAGGSKQPASESKVQAPSMLDDDRDATSTAADGAERGDESSPPPGDLTPPKALPLGVAPLPKKPAPAKRNPAAAEPPPSPEEADSSSSAPARNEAGDGDGAAMPAGPQNIAVTIEKVAPRAAGLHQPMSYVIVVHNTGSQEARGVVVRDEVPNGAEFQESQPAAAKQGKSLTWKLEKLAAGEERKIQVKIVPQKEGPLGSSATVTLSGGASSQTEIARPQLKVSLNGPETATVGDTITFTLQATNPGPVPLSDVRMRADLDAGLQHPQGREIETSLETLEAGQTKQVDLAVGVTSTGRLKCRATAAAAPAGDVKVSDRAEKTVHAVQAHLNLTIAGPKTSYLWGKAKYTLTVSNTGDGKTGNVQVTDALPPGYEVADLVEASSAGTTPDGREIPAQFDRLSHTVIWNLPPLAEQAERKLSLTIKSKQTGELQQHAQATSAPNLHAEDQWKTQIEGIAALSMEVSQTEGGAIEVGATTTYEIHVLSQGTTAATDVVLTAVLPPGLEFQGAPRSPATPHYDESSRTVKFDPVPRLAAKADMTYRVTVRALTEGDHRFKTHLKATELKDAITHEESTKVFRSDQ